MFFNLPIDSQSEKSFALKIAVKMNIIYKNGRVPQRAIFGAGPSLGKAHKATQSANSDAARTRNETRQNGLKRPLLQQR